MREIWAHFSVKAIRGTKPRNLDKKLINYFAEKLTKKGLDDLFIEGKKVEDFDNYKYWS